MADAPDSKSGPRKRVWVQVPPSVLNGLARFRECEPPREPRASPAAATGSDRPSPSGGRTSWRAKWWSLCGFRRGLSLAFNRVNRQESQVVIPVPVPFRPELRPPEFTDSNRRFWAKPRVTRESIASAILLHSLG
jgi:hypothetical protein